VSHVKLEFHLDRSEADRDLYRVRQGPSGFTHRRLDGVLLSQFQATQMVIHVVTGSLKASGSPDSRGGADGEWEGDITYGGELNFAPSPGPARRASNYAIFEFEKPHDEHYDHNWIRAAALKDRRDEYADVLLDWLAEGA